MYLKSRDATGNRKCMRCGGVIDQHMRCGWRGCTNSVQGIERAKDAVTAALLKPRTERRASSRARVRKYTPPPHKRDEIRAHLMEELARAVIGSDLTAFALQGLPIARASAGITLGQLCTFDVATATVRPATGASLSAEHGHDGMLYLWRLRTEVHPSLCLERVGGAWRVHIEGYSAQWTGWIVTRGDVNERGFAALRDGALEMLKSYGIKPIEGA